MKTKAALILSLSILVGMSPIAVASEAAHGDHEDAHHRQHIALFFGATEHHDENEPTVGADYEFRFHRIVGVGALIDRAGGDADTTVAGVGVLVYPYRGLKFSLTPGLENHDGHNEFLVRAGAAYDFHIKSFSISPTINVDFVDSEEIPVFGVSFGYGF